MSAEKKEVARYISRYLRFRIVMVPTRYEIVNGNKITQPGKSIQFDGGFYETSDTEEIAYLDKYCEDNAGTGSVIKAKTENINAERSEAMKTLEERNAELEAENAELKRGKVEPRRQKPQEDGEDGLEALSLAELQEKCRQLEIKATGTKAELIKRIEKAEEVSEGDGQFD